MKTPNISLKVPQITGASNERRQNMALEFGNFAMMQDLVSDQIAYSLRGRDFASVLEIMPVYYTRVTRSHNYT